jgi:hypothetical protein
MTTTPLAALQQHSASALGAGETFVAALRVHPPNFDTAGRQALLGVTASAVLAYQKEKHAQGQAEIPLRPNGAYLGLTESRLLVFDAGVNHPRELLGAVARNGLTLETEEFRQNLTKHEHLNFLADGRLMLDAVCSVKSPDLAAFRDAIPAAATA